MANMERLINIFRAYGDDYWTLRQQILFLKIAAAGSKGITLTDLQVEMVVMIQQQVHKNCYIIANDPKRPGYKGYDLIEIFDDPQSSKRLRVRLTEKGLKMLKELQEELENGK